MRVTMLGALKNDRGQAGKLCLRATERSNGNLACG